MAGRPDKYTTHVQPYLKDIERMALSMSEEQIAKTLGIGYSTFRRCKEQHEQLRAALKNGRRDLVYQLRSTLIKKAIGFEYEEISETYEDGELTKREIKKKYATPDVAALNLLLKNYDAENWANDPQILAIRKKELELAERKIEANEW